MLNTGTPVTINGRTSGTPGPATTTPVWVEIPNLLRPQRVVQGVTIRAAPGMASQLAIRNLEASGGTDLRVYWPDSPNTFFTVKGGESWSGSGVFGRFAVASASGTVQWEATTTVR